MLTQKKSLRAKTRLPKPSPWTTPTRRIWNSKPAQVHKSLSHMIQKRLPKKEKLVRERERERERERSGDCNKSSWGIWGRGQQVPTGGREGLKSKRLCRGIGPGRLCRLCFSGTHEAKKSWPQVGCQNSTFRALLRHFWQLAEILAARAQGSAN